MAPNDPANGSAARSPAPAQPVATESPAARLLRLWQEGSAPDLDAFLAEAGEHSPIQLAAVLHADQRERWRLGQHIPAETYLQRYPRLLDDEEGTADLVYGEFLIREQQGVAPSLDELLWRFPKLAAILKPQIELHRALQAAATPRAAAAETTLPAETQVYEREPGTDPLGPVIPGYEVLGELGRGGMGVVYKARHLRLKRLVALKMLRAGAYAGADELARFRREGEAAARLQHPNIVQVYEVGESDGQPFLVLEFIEGGSLKDFLTGVPQPGRWSAELLETLARAVHYAHTQGIVHRDLKPANILLAVAGDQWPVASEEQKPGSSSLATGHWPLLPRSPTSAWPSGTAIRRPGAMRAVARSPATFSARRATCRRNKRRERSRRSGRPRMSMPWAASCTSCSPGGRPFGRILP